MIYNIPMTITCPWCGTNYTEFHPNCKNCGGVLPAPSEFAKTLAVVEKAKRSPESFRRSLKDRFPDAPPRTISANYLWRLMLADPWTVAALIFTFIGGIFSITGAGLTIGIITAFVGLPFLALGLLFLMGGVGVLVWRYQIAEKRVKVLKEGIAIEGEIIDLIDNPSVRVNGRIPWKITYIFNLDGEEYSGTVSTLNPPGTHLAPGTPAVILYLKENPLFNGLYPHP